MGLTPKIQYQLFLYHYFMKYIKHHLFNPSYDSTKKDLYVQKIQFLQHDIDELNKINNDEYDNYRKSRGYHRKKLFFLSSIRRAVLYNKEFLLHQHIQFIRGIEENENKFMYKNYDEYLYTHINYYKFLQKIKPILKAKYDKKIEDIYKNIYHPTLLSQLLYDNTDNLATDDNIDNAFTVLHNKIQLEMYNQF